MKTRLAIVLLIVPLACGRAERQEAPEPGANPVVSGRTSSAAPSKLPDVAAPTAPAQPRHRLTQAGYQTTTIELPSGVVLDAGEAQLLINTSMKPVRASLEVHARGAGRSVSGKILLDFSDFLAGTAEAPSAVPGASMLYSTGATGEREAIQLSRMELTRLAASGRRTQFLIRAFAPDGSAVATLRTQYDLTCLTDSAEGSPETEGKPADGSAPLTILATDTALRSAACRPFAALL